MVQKLLEVGLLKLRVPESVGWRAPRSAGVGAAIGPQGTGWGGPGSVQGGWEGVGGVAGDGREPGGGARGLGVRCGVVGDGGCSPGVSAGVPGAG